MVGKAAPALFWVALERFGDVVRQRRPSGIHHDREKIVIPDDAEKIDHPLLAERRHRPAVGRIADAFGAMPG